MRACADRVSPKVTYADACRALDVASIAYSTRVFGNHTLGPTIQRLMAEREVTHRGLAQPTGFSAGY
jgi:hypothetical protein